MGAPPVRVARDRRLRALRHPGRLAPLLRGRRRPLVVAVLSALAETGDAKPDEVAEAITRYEIDADSADPWSA